uniref:RING-type E3 ubiquitin transferase n=1 Tax=Chrysotila carterae TaxID=13221 RepID=A0A7S4B5I4_CHRCT
MVSASLRAADPGFQDGDDQGRGRRHSCIEQRANNERTTNAVASASADHHAHGGTSTARGNRKRHPRSHQYPGEGKETESARLRREIAERMGLLCGEHVLIAPALASERVARSRPSSATAAHRQAPTPPTSPNQSTPRQVPPRLATRHLEPPSPLSAAARSSPRHSRAAPRSGRSSQDLTVLQPAAAPSEARRPPPTPNITAMHLLVPAWDDPLPSGSEETPDSEPVPALPPRADVWARLSAASPNSGRGRLNRFQSSAPPSPSRPISRPSSARPSSRSSVGVGTLDTVESRTPLHAAAAALSARSGARSARADFSFARASAARYASPSRRRSSADGAQRAVSGRTHEAPLDSEQYRRAAQRHIMLSHLQHTAASVPGLEHIDWAALDTQHLHVAVRGISNITSANEASRRDEANRGSTASPGRQQFQAFYRSLASLDQEATGPTTQVAAMSTEEIARLHFTVCDDELASSTCAICHEDLQAGENVLRMPSCSHAYHACCIEHWLRIKAACPLCNRRVVLPPRVFAGQRNFRAANLEALDLTEEDL